MHPNNRLTVNAIEAYPLDDFSPEVSREWMVIDRCADTDPHSSHTHRLSAPHSPRLRRQHLALARPSKRPRLRSKSRS